MTREELTAFVNAVLALREGATDAQASTAVGLYPAMHNDETIIKAGTRINWHGTIMRAAVDLQDAERNSPDNAPTLWEALEYKDGYRIIPDTITVGKAFALGERGWWRDELWESTTSSNVYTPEQYPGNWRKV